MLRTTSQLTTLRFISILFVQQISVAFNHNETKTHRLNIRFSFNIFDPIV